MDNGNVPNTALASKNLLFPIGGISLSSNGHHYEVTTRECPGGIFFPQAVNETCLCYNGIFAVVRDCCSEEDGLIATDTLEWRKNYQCGVSPEIGDTGSKPIRAILPLTKSNRPFRPVITLQEFSGSSFSKWRKFDLRMLSKVSGPTAFVNSSTVEIINVRALPKEVRFKIGRLGDVDICYTGWHPGKPKTLRISVHEYSTVVKKNGGYCCFKIREGNSPGIITSPCREGSVVTEMVEIASVNKGNACPNQGKSARAMFSTKRSKKPKVPKNLVRFKRSDSASSETATESQQDKTSSETATEPQQDDTSEVTDEPISSEAGEVDAGIEDHVDKLTYTLEELADDDYNTQHEKIRKFTLYRRQELPEAIKEPSTQRFIFLKKSLEIYYSVIPKEIVPKHFVEDAFEAFYYLYEALDTDSLRLNEDQFQRTLNVLGNCSEKLEEFGKNPEFLYKNGSCPIELEEIAILYPNGTKSATLTAPLPPNWLQFDKTKFDIIVEVNWKIVDFVHSMCFDHFFDDYNAHHFYENQMQILFLNKHIQERWNRSIKEDDNYAKGIIKELNRDVRMKELDKTVGIAHLLSRYTEYLLRPSVEVLKPESDLFRQVQLFEKAVASRLQAARMRKRINDDDDDEDFDIIGNEVHPPIVEDNGVLQDPELPQQDEEGNDAATDDNPLEPPNVSEELPTENEENGIANAEVVDPTFSQEKDVLKHDDMAIKEFARALEENDENPSLVRSKKHIGAGYKTQKNERNMAIGNKDRKHNRVKPGDTIWNGLAVCLDAMSNDNPAYYTQEELWGTRPTLTELGKKYPLTSISM